MKRKDLIRHLEKSGCEFLREGGNHTVYVNRREKKVSTIPRHRDIDEKLARKICNDLGI
ncbi:MAG: type II toxin-antitoxin system HicA family toxin, partial [Nitrospirales bacterium]